MAAPGICKKGLRLPWASERPYFLEWCHLTSLLSIFHSADVAKGDRPTQNGPKWDGTEWKNSRKRSEGARWPRHEIRRMVACLCLLKHIAPSSRIRTLEVAVLIIFLDCLWMIGLFSSKWSYWIRQSLSDKTFFALGRSPRGETVTGKEGFRIRIETDEDEFSKFFHPFPLVPFTLQFPFPLTQKVWQNWLNYSEEQYLFMRLRETWASASQAP